ncbi:MAG: type II toxin-antitoxin system prevent-host-death family antitoxin [Gaiellaceae bacterium]
MEVGVRELRENLAEWLARAAAGDEIVVTERGTPRVRMTAATAESVLDQLIREGRATPPRRPRRPLPAAIEVEGNPVTDELLRQRRSRDY